MHELKARVDKKLERFHLKPEQDQTIDGNAWKLNTLILHLCFLEHEICILRYLSFIFINY